MLYDTRRNGAEEILFGDALQVNVGGDETIRRVIGVL